MARITVEDCVTVVSNRFELCLVASNRAKSILSGAATDFDRKEKPAVISLREIAEGLVNVDQVKKNIVRSIKNRGAFDDSSAIDEVSAEIRVESEEGAVISSGDDSVFAGENIEVED